MPIAKTSQLPPPESWEEFESLCCDLFALIWKDPLARKNGRQGQPQNGVDIYGQPNGGADYAGVQAKNKSVGLSKLTVGELRAEALKARNFDPPISQFIVATTDPTDAKLQAEARKLDSENRKAGLFPVSVLGWGDITRLLANHPELLERYYPEFGFRTAHEPPSLTRIVELLDRTQEAEIEARLPRFARTSGALTSRVESFAPNWGLKQIAGDSLSSLEWTFCGPHFPTEWRHAQGPDFEKNSIMNTFDLTQPPTGESDRVGLDEIGLMIRFQWRGRMNYELHRWPLNPRIGNNNRQQMDIGNELPVQIFAEDL